MKENSSKNYYLQYLTQLKSDITTLEKKLAKPTIYKLTHEIKKNTSKLFHISKHYTASICTIITYIHLIKQGIVGFPFVKTDVKRYDIIKHEYTLQNDHIQISNSNLKYDSFADYLDHAIFYGPWTINPNNTYSRTITVYSFNYFNEEMAIELLNGNTTLSGDIINKVTSYIQTSNNLTSDELKKENYFSVVIYDTDKNNFSIVEENDITSLVYLLILLLITAKFLPNKQKITNTIDKINTKYQATDYHNLQKKLTLKLSNYNRLTNYPKD